MKGLFELNNCEVSNLCKAEVKSIDNSKNNVNYFLLEKLL